MNRAALEVEDLLKIVLGLVILWLLLEIIGSLLSITLTLFNALPTLIGLLIVVLIVLWLTDRI
ncbi:DUF7554 family protein [Halorubrum vacuolatum]|uniref:Uncharacterized protein n=1 Tax=Halorubrum vacuolatum TaxID=63740 RepID=A0A238XWI3_HALVU|nr:hypothetical protein [Halorubrum vacuolatum]SNR62803.1 hypothetical protein SAMN06264855_1248 [Halorubrum vacuolatum]